MELEFLSSDRESAAIDAPDRVWTSTAAKRPVWIDLSRLVWRSRHLTPTGIDRVELAYARHFLERHDRPAGFVARLNVIGCRELNKGSVCRFLECLAEDWSEPRMGGARTSIARLLARSKLAPHPGNGITIIPSHQNWHRASWLKQRRGRDGRLVLFLHDAIPSDYPEYARAGGDRRHNQRLLNALDLADGLIVNSRATAEALARFGEQAGRPLPKLRIAPLGTMTAEPAGGKRVPAEPYFLCVGTIEPRKNHMLLLLLWRQMAEAGIPNIPKLIIAGRRGWENEQVIDLLERSRALRGLVEERSNLGDAELSALVAGARAVLMPSFVEGFGMPVAEALAAGTPVIASDLPVYREIAGDIPEYCNPIDGPAWQSAIMDYAKQDSPRRAAQLARLHGWRVPTWKAHFDHLEALLEELD